MKKIKKNMMCLCVCVSQMKMKYKNDCAELQKQQQKTI